MITYQFSGPAAEATGQRMIDFLRTTNSFRDLENQIEARGIAFIKVVDLGGPTDPFSLPVGATPGYAVFRGVEFVVGLNFQRYHADQSSLGTLDRPITVEEILFHELRHIAAGHVGVTPNDWSISLEQEVVNYTNSTLREELGLSYRTQYVFDGFVLPSGTHYLSGENCFPAGTMIDMWPLDPDLRPRLDGTYDKAEVLAGIWQKRIEEVTTVDKVVAHNAQGNLVPGRVTQLLDNVTTDYFQLSNGTTCTGGHRFLRPNGSFAEIKDILAEDGQIVLRDGTVETVTAKRIVYTAETAHLYEEADKVVYGTSGGAALAPHVEHGWKTYNFTVAEHHTYIANGIRVHNDSILSQLQEGDQLIALNDSLTDAAVFRDVNGDGHADFVTLDGFRDPSEGVFSTRVLKERIRYWEEGNGDWDAELAAVVANNPEAASNVFDPQSLDANGDLIGNHGVLTTGNTWGDGAWGDDIEEAFFNDVMKRAPATSGTTPSRAALDNLATLVRSVMA